MYKVLIAEDEPFIGDSIRKMMERFGPEFEVRACVYDGEAALERLEEESFDVVLTDIRMPGMDGIEVLRRIDRDYPNIITVVISGYEIFDYARKALKYHASEYLLKPVSIDNMKELLAKLKVLLVEREKEQHYQKIFSAVGVGGVEKKEDGSGKEQLAESVRQYLEGHYGEKITTKELSKKFGLVPSYLSTLFRQEQGMSPSDYLNRLRIERAKALLLENMFLTVREIAEITGYADQLYFSKVFKKETGMTPSDFRAAFGKRQD